MHISKPSDVWNKTFWCTEQNLLMYIMKPSDVRHKTLAIDVHNKTWCTEQNLLMYGTKPSDVRNNILDIDVRHKIFWCTEQEHTFNISYRKSQEHELSAHIFLHSYLFLCWIWKACKAQVSPHFSNITHQTHDRHGHLELSVCMVRQLDYYVTICWWRAFL